MSAFQNGERPIRAMEDDSDVEEEALVNDYKEQVQYEDMGEELERVSSLTMAQQADDIQSRLVAAAQPLDFSAPLEVKFQSYDSYCNLFHFILNSDGPVDLEPPSVSGPAVLYPVSYGNMLILSDIVLLGLGCH
jgi:translation initiation factor 3 subunit L